MCRETAATAHQWCRGVSEVNLGETMNLALRHYTIFSLSHTFAEFQTRDTTSTNQMHHCRIVQDCG